MQTEVAEFTKAGHKEALEMIRNSLNEATRRTILETNYNGFFSNSILEDRDFVKGLFFTKASYEGNDLYLETNKKMLIILNISDETIVLFTRKPAERTEEKFLMPLRMLYFAFQAYKTVKGKTRYYERSYNNSCIRHLYDYDLEKYGIREKLEKTFSNNIDQSVRFELN